MDFAIKVLAFILFSCSSCFAQNKATSQNFRYHKNYYELLFFYDTGLEIDFNKETIKSVHTGKPEKIFFSAADKKAIQRSFARNAIWAVKGEVNCYNEEIIVSPATTYKLKVFNQGKLRSLTIVDDNFDLKKISKSDSRYRPAAFVTDLKAILEANADFRKTLAALKKFRKQNGDIEL